MTPFTFRVWRELHEAIETAMMLGYADGAYIYSRMLARYFTRR